MKSFSLYLNESEFVFEATPGASEYDMLFSQKWSESLALRIVQPLTYSSLQFFAKNTLWNTYTEVSEIFSSEQVFLQQIQQDPIYIIEFVNNPEGKKLKYFLQFRSKKFLSENEKQITNFDFFGISRKADEILTKLDTQQNLTQGILQYYFMQDEWPRKLNSQDGLEESLKLLNLDFFLPYEKGGKYTPLQISCAQVEPYSDERVKALIDGGADINLSTQKTGKTPLMLAYEMGNTEAVKLLEKRNELNDDLEDAQGKTQEDYRKEYLKRNKDLSSTFSSKRQSAFHSWNPTKDDQMKSTY